MALRGPVPTPRAARVAAFLLILAAAAAPARAEEPVCAAPNVLVLFDVSGSMKSATNPAGKYAAAVPAITAVTEQFQDDIRFGLMLFPDPAEGYCGVTTDLAVVPAPGTAAAIAGVLTLGEPGFFGGPQGTFDTPLKQALEAAGGVPDLADPGRRSFVLLLTDGMQDCCRQGDYDDDPDCDAGTTNLNGGELQQNRADLVVVVQGLVEQGNPVYVVGFGDKVDALTLNAMAVAAGTDLTGCDPAEANPALGKNCYYRADEFLGDPQQSTEALQAALSAVARKVGEEICDAVDNNCDGATDEGFGVGDPCDSLDDDRCADGQVKCTAFGSARCVEATPPERSEVCDGADNDCNGSTDEGFAVGLPCDGDDGDRCEEGTYACGASGMGVTCQEEGPGHVESCNGDDDDCDGEVDEGSEVECESACGRSVRLCEGGALTACQAPEPLPEDTCGNGRDDDCDGVTDEDWERTCRTDCGEGLETCQGGTWTACTAPPVQAESCNLLDDDCNGSVDDGDLCSEGTQCFCGGCQVPCGEGGACPGGLACADGICVDDRCPVGKRCEGRVCLDIPPTPPADKAGGGCGCRTGAGPATADGAPLVALALAAAAWALARRRRAL